MCFRESPERRNSGVIVRFFAPSLPRQNSLPVRGKINLHCLSLSPARSAQRKFFFAILGAKGSSSLCQESSPLYIDWRQSIHKHPSPTEAGQLALSVTGSQQKKEDLSILKNALAILFRKWQNRWKNRRDSCVSGSHLRGVIVA